jgi:hypothetical protein
MSTTPVMPLALPRRWPPLLAVTEGMVDEYWATFVNRLAYLVQRHTPTDNGKFSYYAPRDKVSQEKLPLTRNDVRMHLAGLKTISLYAIEPVHSTCKWIAIDADYGDAFPDLAKIKSDLAESDIEAVLEKSNRGGHLWIFGAEPMPAHLCRLMIYNIALRHDIPIKGFNHAVDGIEIFPRQSKLEEGQFGNALRGPLGVHRKSARRYWFDGVLTQLQPQFDYLRKVRRLTLAELEDYTDGLTMPEPEVEPAPTFAPVPAGFKFDTFDIRKYVRLKDRTGKNMWGQCPSCAKQGHDRGRDNLAVNKTNPNLYCCWAGCTADDIREAVGAPRRQLGTYFAHKRT